MLLERIAGKKYRKDIQARSTGKIAGKKCREKVQETSAGKYRNRYRNEYRHFVRDRSAGSRSGKQLQVFSTKRSTGI